MLCPACATPSLGVCPSCASTLRRAAPRVVAGCDATAAWMHRDAAAVLVRNVKYRRSTAGAIMLASAMGPLMPLGADALAPIPRSVVRRVRYGIDPAGQLASLLGASIGLPVIQALRAPMWWPRRAGRSLRSRGPVGFRSSPKIRGIAELPRHLVLVDDVLTSGATATSAIRALPMFDRISLLTATSAGTMGGGADSIPRRGGGVAHPRPMTTCPPTRAPADPVPMPDLPVDVFDARRQREEDE